MNEQVYAVPVGNLRTECRLRLVPTRNNQARRVRFAADYDIHRWSAEALVEVVTTGRCDPPRDATPLALASGAPGG